ncbi:MAG TPA: AAA family ATPase [Gemmatimonadaceae bacterium]|nr:AAA family ATPase [Gemmatimonadaceae bacterium]
MSDERQNDSSGEEAASVDRRFELETLGAPALASIASHRERAIIFGPSKPLALLVYLACIPGGSATREFLIDLLWADLDPTAARHAFRQTLWYIKQKTGRSLISTAADTVSLAERLPSDRDTFLHAIEKRDFESAVALYPGDFLPNFAVPGGVEFEHWADLERQRLRDTFIRAAEQVTRQYLSVARNRDAVGLARRARDTAPLTEQGWRLVLEALVSAKDALGAALEADALQKMLDEDDRTPEPATRAMLRTVRQLSTDPMGGEVKPGVLVAELVGRELEFSTLLAAWDEARSARPRHVAVTGPAGIGKTRLIGDLAARLRAKRGRVVWVRANPGEREIAYALLSRLAGALAELPGAAAVSPATASSLVALNPTVSASFDAAPDRTAGEEALRHRTIAVHELLAVTADESPVTVIVDDLHWADRESARALSGVIDGLEQEPVLVITSARPSAATLATGGRNSTDLRLVPLTTEAVGAMLTSIAALPNGPDAEELPSLLCEVTDGVPLFVLETLQLLLERELLGIEQGHWTVRDATELRATMGRGGALRRRIEALDDTERRLLQSMAVAGVPLPAGFLADTSHRPLADIAAVLHALEVRGMVIHGDDGWAPVHDQIAELALERVCDEARKELEAAVARAWMHAGDTDYALRRAGLHFLRAGDDASAAQTFAKWVRRLRQAGDHRDPRALAGEFLDQDDPARAQRLVRALPFQYRYTSARWRIAAMIAFVAIASAATTWGWTREATQPPDETFLALTVDSLNDTAKYVVGVRRDEWHAGEPLVVARAGHRSTIAFPTGAGDYALSPDGKAWISKAASPDSGGDDLMLEPFTGGRQRMTWSRGDDIAPNLSPDGTRLVFLSGRFDSLSHTQVAVMDLATKRVRQLTFGTDKALAAKWSPSGLLIAYGRLSWSDGSDSLCIVPPDGSRHVCYATPGQTGAVGWIDDNRALVSVTVDSLSILEMFDVRDGSARRIFASAAGSSFYASADARWIECLCRVRGSTRYETTIFPADHPELARPVVGGLLDTKPVLVGWLGQRRRDYVTSLHMAIPAGGLQLGTDYRVPVTGETVEGRHIPVPFTSITSQDTAILRVLHGNRLLPVAPGTVRVIVSAGGWRTDTITMAVVPAHDSVAVREDWAHGIGREFVPFGVPAPQVVVDSATRHATFFNNGDGDFTSGVYTAAALDPSAGIGMEATVSTPVTMLQWQTANLTLMPVRDSAALATWDRTTGYLPIDGGTPTGTCEFSYPSDEGVRSPRTMTVATRIVDPDSIFHRSFADGHWFRVRVQLFSDGRCGVAIDGRPVAIVPVGPPPTTRYVGVIDGASYHTRILTGPVEIWTGVKPGVDWLAFDTTQTAAAHRRR